MSITFRQLADQAMLDPDVQGLRPVVEKELLDYEILSALILEGLLKDLTFQGGTSLRLLHGAVRYSEDLDFSAGPGFSTEHAGDIAGAIQNRVAKNYVVPVQVRPPSQKPRSGPDPVTVSTWSIRVETRPEQPNMPSQKIKIDIDTSVSHSSEPRTLMLNYSFLPSGYGDLIIRSQSLEEVMSNKLVALPVSIANRNPPRHRDLWDLRWLSQRGVRPNVDFIRSKAAEHGVDNYEDILETALGKIDDIVQSGPFAAEMLRFLPAAVRGKTIESPDWMMVLARTNRELISSVIRGLTAPGGTEFEF